MERLSRFSVLLMVAALGCRPRGQAVSQRVTPSAESVYQFSRTDSARARFWAAGESLSTSPDSLSLKFGTPISTEFRPVVNSYVDSETDSILAVRFENVAFRYYRRKGSSLIQSMLLTGPVPSLHIPFDIGAPVASVTAILGAPDTTMVAEGDQTLLFTVPNEEQSAENELNVRVASGTVRSITWVWYIDD